MRRLLPAALTLALAAPGPALAARFAVGIEPGASPARVAARVEAATGGSVSSLGPLQALIVEAPDTHGVAALPGVAYVESLDSPRRLAFTPNDPLVSRQWYLAQDRAFDFWPQPPVLPGVRVAVIDSGIDGDHPEFAGRIVAARSFVGGSPYVDRHGHGTFVAGVIAAATGNGQGIAGIAFPAELLVAKVVRADRTIPLDAEARAIRWAVNNGARVLNLSLGGLRDPLNPKRDTFSPLEAAAVAYAYSKGAVVVAAVGNGDQAPVVPWKFASYPAALPHVIGVSALARDGSVPAFSNRDAVYNDIAAPGEEILSTLPRTLTAARATCQNQGYSDCGPPEYRRAEGTSFAAAQVTAAAALLLSVNPDLAPDQASAVLERSADDANVNNGCRSCPLLRDALSGWGRLDIAAAIGALQGPLPPPDRYEANDDAGGQAATLWGKARRVTATIDFWDDQNDVYRVRLRPGQRLSAAVRGPAGTDTNLLLWKPGTQRVEGLSLRILRMRAAQSARPGPVEQFSYRARKGGWYFLQVKLATPGAGPYSLRFSKK